MKNRIMITTTAMTIALSARADISNLDWMTGCWALTGQEKGSIEQWSTPAGKTMLGFNRVVSAGQTIAFEFLRIVEEDEKAMILVASPSGQETASFRAIESSNSKVVFENSEHDFPQRIIYRLDENRNLVGRIEGTINGEARAVDFPMTRTSCDDDSNSQD